MSRSASSIACRPQRAVACAATALALALAAQSAVAQEYERQVRSQIRFVRSTVLGAGWHETHDLKTGSMREGASREFNIRLDAGRNYRLVAVCDDDCEDIDLTLYDGQSRLIDQDLDASAMPIVRVRPRWSEEFKLRLTMSTCSTNPCHFGIAVFSD